MMLSFSPSALCDDAVVHWQCSRLPSGRRSGKEERVLIFLTIWIRCNRIEVQEYSLDCPHATEVVCAE